MRKYGKSILISIVTIMLSFILIPSITSFASVQMNPAYDLSEWQHQLSDTQVQNLKQEASFVILRVQYGSQYHDHVFDQNVKLLQKYQIPYGVYSYSLYTSPNDAQVEAKSLYQAAPNANFYVNDCEENDVTTSTIDNATNAWVKQMRQLTNKHIILYSGLDFMNNNFPTAKNNYDALWIADYSSYEPDPNYQYDLWQFTDSYHSVALGQNVDASVIPTGGKPLSFWTNANNQTATKKQPKKPRVIKTTPNQNGFSVNSKMITNKILVSHNYYQSHKIKKLTVISKHGINTYQANGQKYRHYAQGKTLNVVKIVQVKNYTRAMTTKNNYFTTNKKYVKWSK